MSNNIRVVCRFRPSNSKELAMGAESIASVDESGTTVTIKGAESTNKFNFDRVFINANQKEVYEYSAKPVVEDILKGYNGTIFVYGQTSSGKTHTMQGPNIKDQELKGIIPRMNGTIFESIGNADPDIEFLVKASYIEIYMEKIQDLLDTSKSNLKVREEKSKGIWVEGATEVYVSSEEDVVAVIEAGQANRSIAETKMNAESSRSHSIFILTINQKNLRDLSNKTGKMYLVDLAGSEKVEKTGAQGTTLDEAKMINKSLSSLGNVINALTDGKSAHIPYRDSKLTRVLQESLGGNSRTTLIINCSPSSYNEAETISTLRFGTRAKSIKNAAKINQERSVAELKLLLVNSEKEIAKLHSTITVLQEEVNILKGGGTPLPRPQSTGNLESLNTNSTPGSVSTPSSPSPSSKLEKTVSLGKLQEKCLELENVVRKLEEEKQNITDLHENFVEELKEREAELENLEQMKEEIFNLRESEQTLSKENELLIVKLADITIDNEKMQYDSNEQQIQLETLAEQNEALQKELEQLSAKVETLTADKNKANDEIDTAINENRGSLLDSKEAIHNAKAEHELLTALRMEIESQKNQIIFLQKEKESHELNIKTIRSEYEQQLAIRNDNSTSSTTSPIISNSNSSNVDNKLVIERELQLVREQTNQKLLEFDALKTALLRDLENRCQKVIELEILLDEAREQYQTLLVQVKNSNSKTLQQKCVFLQRNLEQLTAVQQQLVNENNRLKLENQVCVKQLAIRNERIHGLEMLLQDAQEKLQKHATSNESKVEDKSATFKRGVVTIQGGAQRKAATGNPNLTLNNLQQGGRIAKPIRGGGKPSDNSGSTTEKKSSIWDIFRGKKTEQDGSNGTPTLSQSSNTSAASSNLAQTQQPPSTPLSKQKEKENL